TFARTLECRRRSCRHHRRAGRPPAGIRSAVGVTTLAYLTGLLGRETRPARLAQRARIAERRTLVTPDGRSISYLRGGDAGETRLIFLHGSPANGSMFVNHVTSGAAGLERVAIDRLGFG